MLHYLLVWWYFGIKKWKVVGSFPYHLKKSVIIVAPHTHSNDFWAGIALRKKIHLEFVRFLGKKELFVVEDKLGVPTYTKDFALSILRHIKEGLPYGLYNMVSQGEASRYETAIAIKEYLNLDLVIHKVGSNFFKEEYFAPRPYSEKLINNRLDKLGKNYMRNWKICLQEYLEEFNFL